MVFSSCFALLLVVVGRSFLHPGACCCIPPGLGPGIRVPYIPGIWRVFSSLLVVHQIRLRCIRLGPGIFGMVPNFRGLKTRNIAGLCPLHSLVGFLVDPINSLFLFS